MAENISTVTLKFVENLHGNVHLFLFSLWFVPLRCYTALIWILTWRNRLLNTNRYYRIHFSVQPYMNIMYPNHFPVCNHCNPHERPVNLTTVLGITSCCAWWRHQMKYLPLLALCEGNPPVTGAFPSDRAVTRSFEVFFDLRLTK